MQHLDNQEHNVRWKIERIGECLLRHQIDGERRDKCANRAFGDNFSQKFKHCISHCMDTAIFNLIGFQNHIDKPNR